jgi:diamine N-acetyltransferase
MHRGYTRQIPSSDLTSGLPATTRNPSPPGPLAGAEEFHRSALPHIFREPAELLPSRSFYAALVNGPDSALFVAEEGDELIGFVTVREERAPDDPLLAPRRFAMVDMLAVGSDRRRRGIGRALMEATHRWAENRGLEELELNVWEFNQRAIAFYEALGYDTLSRHMVRRSR